METADNFSPPGDPKLVDNIVNHLKAQGIFDQFRHDCLADVDTKPSYQNLRQRVDGFVSRFLSNETWSPELNKNQSRNDLRRQIDESGMLALGVEHVVEQVVNAKIYQVLLPKIEVIVREYLSKVDQQKEEEPSDKNVDMVDATVKTDSKSAVNDSPDEILKEVTVETPTKSQKCTEESVNNETLKLDLYIRPEVEKSAAEKRSGFPDRAADVKMSTQSYNDLKPAENVERKDNSDTKKTPDGKLESRVVNSKLNFDSIRNKLDIDVIRRLDKSWLKQREKARLKYEEPVIESPEKNYSPTSEDYAMSPEKNKTPPQNDVSNYLDSTKPRKSELANLKSGEKYSKYKRSTSKVHRSKQKAESVEEAKQEAKSKSSKSSDFGNTDAYKDGDSEEYNSEVKEASGGGTKLSKSSETRRRESSRNTKVKNEYEKTKSVRKSESKLKTRKPSCEVHSSRNKSKSEKDFDDLSRKIDTVSKRHGSKSPNIPKKEKEDRNKYFRKELSVEKKLLEYNKLADQKTYDGRTKRESSISRQGSGQEIHNDEYDKYDSRKIKYRSPDSRPKSKELSVAQSNNKMIISDAPEVSEKSDLSHMSPMELNEESSSSSSSDSSMQESPFSSSESDNAEESDQSSGSSAISESEDKEMCVDGRKCNTPPPPPLAQTNSKESRTGASKSHRKNTDSVNKKNDGSPSSNAKTERGSSDTVSNSLNDSMFLSSASSSSIESFLSHESGGERHVKSTAKLQVTSGNESDGAWSCVSDVSSVHTSDLSSFDDQISLSSSDDEHGPRTRREKKKKKKKQKLSLKEVKQIAEEIDSADNEKPVKRELKSEKHKAPRGRKENASTNTVTAAKNGSKDVSSSDEDTSVADSHRKNSRKRKRNPKHALQEDSSFFSPSKRADTRKSADRNISSMDPYSSELCERSAVDCIEKNVSIQDNFKKSSPKKTYDVYEEATHESNEKIRVSTEMDVHSGVAHGGGNDSSSDFSDIISDGLSSDEETVQRGTAVKSEIPQSRNSSSEDSILSLESDEETSNRSSQQKRKYSDSSDHKTSDDIKDLTSVLENDHHKLDNNRFSEGISDTHEMNTSSISSSKSKRVWRNHTKDTARSKRSTVSVGEEVIPRKRGRPRKYPVGYVHVARPIRTDDPSGKRRRGRPRKYPPTEGSNNNKSRVEEVSAAQQTDTVHPHENSNTEGKGRQLRRNSLERTATRSSRRLSAGSETSEPVTRPRRKSTEHSHNSSFDHQKNDSQYRADHLHSSKWYDSSDLYKPRPVISSSSRRSRAHLHHNS